MEPKDGAGGWSHPFVALRDGSRYRWAVVHQLCLEHIQIPPILHCLGAFFAASLCTALKLMPGNESLLENNLSFDYRFNAGSPGNSCLCQAVSPPADVGNCWEGLLGKLEESQTTGKCLGGDCEEEEEEEDERGPLLDRAPGPLLEHPCQVPFVIQGVTN